MSEYVEKTSQDEATGETTRTVRTDRDSNTTNTAARVVWYIAGVLLTLLAFRFVLILLGANQSNGFANFIYSVSKPFAQPFFGLFGYRIDYGVSRVELSTLVAMAVYALVAFGIVKLLMIRRDPANS